MTSAMFDRVLNEICHNPLDRADVSPNGGHTIDRDFDRAVRRDQKRRKVGCNMAYEY